VIVGRSYDVREQIGGWFARGAFNAANDAHTAPRIGLGLLGERALGQSASVCKKSVSFSPLLLF
jgi:hypothetical protein